MKNKYQSYNFKNVEEFLDFLHEDELKIVEALRNIIFNCIPDAIEKLTYNVPFYKRHKNICFIWPASILWGTKQTHKGVRIGFNSGYLLQDEVNFLDKGNRKQVYWKEFLSTQDIDIDLLKSYLYEAAIIDDQLGSKMKK